jgi:serine/threonine protein kinase
LVYEDSRWGSLDAFLAANAPVPPTIKVALCRAVASGLHALHSNYVGHCDVKAANVLVFFTGDGGPTSPTSDFHGWTAKFCDFEQAIIGDPNNLDAGFVCGLGTPLFSAPELLCGNCWNGRRGAACAIDAALATDVYSFGLLAWQVLADGWNYCQVYLESKYAAPGDTVESVLARVPRSTIFHVVQGLLDKEISRLHVQDQEVFNIITAATLEDIPSDRQSASGF